MVFVECAQLLCVAGATSGDEPEGNAESQVRLLEAAPLMIAALYYLCSPFFSKHVGKRLNDYLLLVDGEWTGPTNGTPPHRTSQSIGATLDWVTDAPQMVPVLLLPLTASVFAFQGTAAAIILGFASVLICVLTLWIYFCPPLKYRSLRLIGHRYTVVSMLGMLLNGGAAALLFFR